jgi:bifunctional DNA-binding transcriptional regulator/antitoxin component of YhaV-PrlF toxin-antitoxin module
MSTPAKKITFETELSKFDPESGWHFIGVEKAAADSFDFPKGSRRVICTINERESFPCALMPYDGAFFIMVNKKVRTTLGIEAGDIITVEIEKDDSKYGMPMPPELQEVLDQDPEGSELFEALTPGKQRGMLYYIGKFKDIDRRIHCSLIFLQHLKNNGGKLDHAKLQQDLKRPIVDF